MKRLKMHHVERRSAAYSERRYIPLYHVWRVGRFIYLVFSRNEHLTNADRFRFTTSQFSKQRAKQPITLACFPWSIGCSPRGSEHVRRSPLVGRLRYVAHAFRHKMPPTVTARRKVSLADTLVINERVNGTNE